MGVPAHDERDAAFARANGLPAPRVLDEAGRVTYSGARFDELPAEEARAVLLEELQKWGAGERATSYRLRDWLASRQRAWGTPIPMVHCAACGVVPVPEAHLPVLRAEGDDPAQPCVCPKCGGAARRDPDTLDTFVDSSWYFVRYCDPRNAAALCDRAGRPLDGPRRRRPLHRGLGARHHSPALRTLF